MSHKIKLLQNVKTAKASYPFGMVFDYNAAFLKWLEETDIAFFKLLKAEKINNMIFEVKNVSE